jgi:hypothetical protein
VARRLIILSLLALAATVPASAQAQVPADVARIESAIAELAQEKRDSQDRLSAQRRTAEQAMAACRTKGPGWTRIRKVRDRAQRNAYARGAKELWRKLHEVAVEGAWVVVYRPHFERFLRRFDTPPADPVLAAGIEAQRKRLAYNEAAHSFGSCDTFNTLLGKVREFKIGGRHGVAGDYHAGRIHNVFVRYAPDRQRTAARAHWGSHYDIALEAARNQLKALGGDEGRANYFAFAFRG